MEPGDRLIVDTDRLDALFEALRRRGYRLVGPTLRGRAIVYEELRSAADLPRGFADEQEGGRYRLKARPDGALFGYAVGPHSWKKLLHPPVVTLWRARREKGGFQLQEAAGQIPRQAFVGVRACELAAIAVQDRVFLGGAHVDPAYRARREATFLLVVNCGQAGGTCFCVSTKTGPRATSGFDLALTELLEADGHRFLLEVGTARGGEVAAELPPRAATERDVAAAEAAVARAAAGMGRRLETKGLKDLLYRNYEHPRWEEVARRCLTCANCTMVCPTCFCATVEDATDLSGVEAERRRRWDSCFSMDFSYIHGGSVRTSAGARYRQWMTHKLATWHDQFGSSGCVGCGRCITWCPAGIDITEEARAIREADSQGGQDRAHRDI